MKQRTLVASLLAGAFAIVFSGCATVISGSSQRITINSNPPGALVRIGDQSGRTPVTLLVQKGKDYPVEVSQGPDKRIFPLRRQFDAITLLNLIPPLWPGFIVDAVTGSITTYKPNVVWVDFRTGDGVTHAHLTRSMP